MCKRLFTCFALVAGLSTLSGGSRLQSAGASSLDSLVTLFDVKSGMVRDTNRDGLADTVAARVIIPAQPTDDDLEAATNIAARLSYETTAMTLPLVLRDDQVAMPEGIGLPILVGRENRFLKRLLEKQNLDLKALAAGQGLIALARSPLGGPDGIAVVGGDDAGTLAAGVELAARLPRLWNMTGITLAGIEQQVGQYLKRRSVAAASGRVAGVLVDSDRRGIATVIVRVSAAAADRPRVMKAVQDLDAAHRAGREPDVLDFAEAASTTIVIDDDSLVAGLVVATPGAKATPDLRAASADRPALLVRRSGMNARTLTPPIDPDELLPETPATGDRAGGTGAAAAVAEPPAGGGEAAGTAAAGGGRAGAAASAGGGATSSAGGGGRGAATSAAAPTPAPGAPTPPAPAKPFDLTGVYSLDGWLGDAYQDLIPDRVETSLILGEARDSFGATHIAARLGLESTGITLPLTKRADKVKQPQSEPSPILVGRENKLVQQLVKIGKVRLDDLQPGEGAVQVVPRAFANATATVVAGADPAGTEAASLYLARRVPYLWDNRRGAASLDDVVTEAGRFFGARSGASHAAQAVGELKGIIDDLRDKKIESIDAKVFLEKADPAFAKYVENQIRDEIKNLKNIKDAKVSVATQGVTDPVPVFEDKLEIPWEVDEFWTKFRADVLPKVKAGATVDLEARLSESPEIRRGIVEVAKQELAKAGAASPRVRVLSAYKQGFSWVTEQVMPELKGKNIRGVAIKVLAHKPDLTKKYKFYQVPSRWLQELFPADEIFKRDIGLPLDAFRMELVDEAKDVYSLEATDARGKVVYQAAFSPKTVEREYLDKFPGWAKVDVTIGWLLASVDGKPVVDMRIETDPEHFWDYYQSKVLPRVYDNVMRVTGGRPTSDKQPFFRDFDVEVWMSEPDFPLGVDEEQISSLESLHEDIYFVTLDFFQAMGRTLTRQRLNAPGKVLPIIHPARPGKAGEARVLYAGNAATHAKLDITYKEKGVEKPTTVSRDLGRINVTAAQAMRAVARPDRVSELDLQVDATDDHEAGRAVDALDNLVRLQTAGLYKTAFSYDHVDRVAFTIVLRDARTRRIVRNTGTSAPSNIRSSALAGPSLQAGAKTAAGATCASPPPEPVTREVAWDHVISPDEAEQIVAKLSAYPEMKAYKVGESYRGRDLSVMEVTLPTPSEQVSIAKLSAYKPTIFIIGRQHANEVSSTGHILRLGELLATDATYCELLKKVNVILCPVENPDGAQISYDLQKLTPTHMLHAGRYSALGSDVGTSSSTLLPEAEVPGKIWREWLPDIYLNPHGYPSHEWVQQFSGYVPPGFRAYWDSRGWYTLMTNNLRDPRYPAHEDAARAIREAIVEAVNANPDVHQMDLRHQQRYTRWAYGYAPHVYNMEVYKDTTIFFSDPESGEMRGSRRAGGSGAPSTRRASMSAWPQVTIVAGTTEAPDETAQGPWMNLVTKAGFSFLMAHVNYLKDGQYKIERIEEGGQRDNATLTTLRVRPVLPRRPVPTKPTT